jgi:hypothetical protein
MPIDVDIQAIEEKIRKLQLLKELVSDPDIQQFLKEVSTNGHSPKAAPTTGLAVRVRPVTHRNDNSSRPRGYFLNAVQDIVALAAHEFTTEDIELRLREREIAIRAANPNIAINEALRTLEDRGIVEKTRKRIGMRIVWRKLIPANSAVESRTA